MCGSNCINEAGAQLLLEKYSTFENCSWNRWKFSSAYSHRAVGDNVSKYVEHSVMLVANKGTHISGQYVTSDSIWV